MSLNKIEILLLTITTRYQVFKSFSNCHANIK